MRMMLALLATLMTIPLSAAAQEAKPKEAGQQVFSFYGLRFGMSPAEVKAAIATNEAGTEVLSPGHGMTFLVLAYDFRNRLQEIRASYPRPAEPLQEEAVRRGLREKFFQPIGLRWRGLTITLDEYSNQAALTLVIASLDQREEAINHFKDEFLKLLE